MLLLVFWFLLLGSSSTQSKRKLGFVGDVIFFFPDRRDLSYRIFSKAVLKQSSEFRLLCRKLLFQSAL